MLMDVRCEFMYDLTPGPKPLSIIRQLSDKENKTPFPGTGRCNNYTLGDTQLCTIH